MAPCRGRTQSARSPGGPTKPRSIPTKHDLHLGSLSLNHIHPPIHSPIDSAMTTSAPSLSLPDERHPLSPPTDDILPTSALPAYAPFIDPPVLRPLA